MHNDITNRKGQYHIMNNPLKAIICSVLAILTLLSLVSCNLPPEPPIDKETESTSESVGAPESTDHKLVLVDKGTARYTIIRCDSTIAPVISACSNLYSSIYERTSAMPTFTTDYVYSESPADNNNYEILIGPTVRSQSQAIFASLKANDFYIGVQDNKIIIVGGNNESTLQAIEWFKQNVMSTLESDPDGSSYTITVPAAFRFTPQYAYPDFKIGDTALSDFVMVYNKNAEIDDLSVVAQNINKYIGERVGSALTYGYLNAHSDAEHKIVLGNISDDVTDEYYSVKRDPFEYCVKMVDGVLYVLGGSSWAIEYGAKNAIGALVSEQKDMPNTYSTNGSAMSYELFPKEDKTNLRIMTNNVWANDSNQPAWSALGEDCSAKHRAVYFAGLYMALRPDVINLQESTTLAPLILNNMKKYGVEYIHVELVPGNALIYNPETLTLIDSGSHDFDYGNNGGKGYTWGYFQLNGTDSYFITLSTHMWYKSDTAQAGSSKMREQQASEIAEIAKILVDKYNCPMFVCGDLNTKIDTDAFRNLTNAGFENCFNLATVYADTSAGRHTCSPSGFAKETSPGSYTASGIDHILVKNKGDTEIRIFTHTTPYFYIKLSDHYPLYVDVSLK